MMEDDQSAGHGAGKWSVTFEDMFPPKISKASWTRVTHISKPSRLQSQSVQGWGLVPGDFASSCSCIYFSISSVKVLVAQSCLTLCNPIDCSRPGSFVHGISPGKDTGGGCHSLLQGIFPTQGLDLGLLHCRQILYCLSCQFRPFPINSKAAESIARR